MDEWSMDSEWTLEPDAPPEHDPTALTRDTRTDNDDAGAWSLGALLAWDGEPGLAEWFDDWG